MQRIAPLIPLRNRQRQRRIKNRRQRIHKRHIRLNARETFGSHIRHGTHQQATGGTAIGHRASRRRQTGTLQRAGVDAVAKIEVEAGHGGTSGRYKQWEEISYENAWCLGVMGITS